MSLFFPPRHRRIKPNPAVNSTPAWGLFCRPEGPTGRRKIPPSTPCEVSGNPPLCVGKHPQGVSEKPPPGCRNHPDTHSTFMAAKTIEKQRVPGGLSVACAPDSDARPLLSRPPLLWHSQRKARGRASLRPMRADPGSCRGRSVCARTPQAIRARLGRRSRGRQACHPDNPPGNGLAAKGRRAQHVSTRVVTDPSTARSAAKLQPWNSLTKKPAAHGLPKNQDAAISANRRRGNDRPDWLRDDNAKRPAGWRAEWTMNEMLRKRIEPGRELTERARAADSALAVRFSACLGECWWGV
jgi:hypothetical protein